MDSTQSSAWYYGLMLLDCSRLSCVTAHDWTDGQTQTNDYRRSYSQIWSSGRTSYRHLCAQKWNLLFWSLWGWATHILCNHVQLLYEQHPRVGHSHLPPRRQQYTSFNGENSLRSVISLSWRTKSIPCNSWSKANICAMSLFSSIQSAKVQKKWEITAL